MLKKKHLVILLLTILIVQQLSYGCTVTFWNDIPNKLISRNMDWYANVETEFWVLPRGIKREGLAGKNSLKWESKYGSAIIYFEGPVDGVNEKGLSGHLLWLAEADYGKRDEKKPGLALALWLQYYLDNFATVEEAVKFTKSKDFQIAATQFEGRNVGLHMYLADKKGDAAVIEYLNGKPVIHHGKEYRVLTNSPTYDKQLAELSQYKAFGGTKELPGSTEAASRFVRGLYYLENLPEPINFKDGIAKIFSVARNTSQPFRIPDPTTPEISITRWRTVTDLESDIYFFESVTSPDIVWLDIKKLNFEKGSDILKVQVVPNNYLGEINDKLEKAPEMFTVPLPENYK